jgi:SpoIID/LytB domain protein
VFKKHVAFFTAVFFIFSMFPLAFKQKVHAYQNKSYFNDLKIGLTSMSSTSLTLTLNGDYSLNGQAYPSGSVLNLGLNGTSVTLNGTLLAQVNLTPSSSSGLLTITSGTISNKYMGSFIIKVFNGKLLPINYLDMENYLKGVVAYEMSDNFPLEALKAQAVAARNYALSRIGYEAVKGYDFDDTPAYQVYKGYNPNYKNVLNAVEQTKGQVILYNDKLVEALYSAWHGGISENSENVWGNNVPYLRSVIDTFENDPWPNGNRVFNNSQIQSTLITKGYLTSTDTFLRLDLNSITKYPSGRVSNINIVYKNSLGIEQTKSVIRDSTRTFLGLPSNLYTVTYDSVSGAYTFSGKGNGHGLGMSQIGAKNRASAGQAYDQILKFYYQGSYLQNLILKASLVSVGQSASEIFLGGSISFNASATGGNGYGYLYKYVVKNGSNVVFTKDFSSLSTLDFSPVSAGSYTVEAYVKDKFSISEFDDKRVASFKAYSNPVLSGMILSKESTLVNQTISASMEVTEGSGSYLYKYALTKDGVLITTRDFSSDRQFAITPSEAGSYTITGYVKDSLSTKAYDIMESKNFSVYDNLTITSFSRDIQSVFLGDSVNFNASVGGGSGSGVKYKYVVTKDGQSITSRDYQLSKSFNFTPDALGSYEVSVYAVDSVSSNEYDSLSKMDFAVKARPVINSIIADKNPSFVNKTVVITAAGSTNDALYKFIVTKNGSEVLIQEYSASSSLSFIPLSSGNYTVSVFVKDTASLKEYDDTKSLELVVYNQTTIELSNDKASILLGDSASYTINAASGSGSIQYRFTAIKDGIVVKDSGYSASNTYVLTPSEAGIYTVIGYIKDALSDNEFDNQKSVSLTVYNPQLSSTTASSYFYEGKPVSLTASSKGTSPSGFSYRFEVYKNSILIASSSYSSMSSFSFTPTASGSYTIKVYGKDGLSSKGFDSMKQVDILVNAKPLYLSVLPLKLGMKNNDVVSLQKALIQLGYKLSGATGNFDSQTKNAVTSFQKSRGLTADGIVGSLTYKALNDALIEKAGIKNMNF